MGRRKVLTIDFVGDEIVVDGHAQQELCMFVSVCMQTFIMMSGDGEGEWGHARARLLRKYKRETSLLVYILRYMAAQWPTQMKAGKPPSWLNRADLPRFPRPQRSYRPWVKRPERKS